MAQPWRTISAPRSLTVDIEAGYDAVVAVDVERYAVDDGTVRDTFEHFGRAFTTWPRLASDRARRIGFWGIDAPDADTLAVQLEGVAVDHQGRTMSAGRGGDVVC